MNFVYQYDAQQKMCPFKSGKRKGWDCLAWCYAPADVQEAASKKACTQMARRLFAMECDGQMCGECELRLGRCELIPA